MDDPKKKPQLNISDALGVLTLIVAALALIVTVLTLAIQMHDRRYILHDSESYRMAQYEKDVQARQAVITNDEDFDELLNEILLTKGGNNTGLLSLKGYQRIVLREHIDCGRYKFAIGSLERHLEYIEAHPPIAARSEAGDIHYLIGLVQTRMKFYEYAMENFAIALESYNNANTLATSRRFRESAYFMVKISTMEDAGFHDWRGGTREVMEDLKIQIDNLERFDMEDVYYWYDKLIAHLEEYPPER